MIVLFEPEPPHRFIFHRCLTLLDSSTICQPPYNEKKDWGSQEEVLEWQHLVPKVKLSISTEIVTNWTTSGYTNWFIRTHFFLQYRKLESMNACIFDNWYLQLGNRALEFEMKVRNLWVTTARCWPDEIWGGRGFRAVNQQTPTYEQLNQQDASVETVGGPRTVTNFERENTRKHPI